MAGKHEGHRERTLGTLNKSSEDLEIHWMQQKPKIPGSLALPAADRPPRPGYCSLKCHRIHSHVTMASSPCTEVLWPNAALQGTGLQRCLFSQDTLGRVDGKGLPSTCRHSRRPRPVFGRRWKAAGLRQGWQRKVFLCIGANESSFSVTFQDFSDDRGEPLCWDWNWQPVLHFYSNHWSAGNSEWLCHRFFSILREIPQMI